MSIEISTLGVDFDTGRLRLGQDELAKLGRAANKAADDLDGASKKGNNALGSLRRGYNAVAAAMAALGVVNAVRKVAEVNDAWGQVEGRLRLVTKSSAELVAIQDKLFAVSQRTGVAYTETANLYAKVAKNADELGLSQQQLLDFTTITNQAIQVSGATAIEAAGGVRQLGQALASGALRGDEFNSLAENMPRLRDAIANGLGISIGKLREFAAEGKLTADVVTKALLSQKDIIEQEFSSLPMTIGRSMTELQNTVQRAIAAANTKPLTEAIQELGKTLSDPRVTEGLTKIATAIVTVARWAALAASGVATMATNIGELAAVISLNSDAWDVLGFLAYANPLAIGPAVSKAAEQIVFGVKGVERTAREAAPAVAGFFNELNALTKPAAAAAIPLRSTSDTLIPFRNNLVAGKVALAGLTKEQEEAAKAIKKANEAATLANKVTERAIALAKTGVALDEAETRAKMELDGINAAEIEKTIRLDKEKAKLAKTQADLTQAYQDYLSALDSAAGGAESEEKRIQIEIDQTRRLLQLIDQGVSMKDAEATIEAEFAESQTQRLAGMREELRLLLIRKGQYEEALALEEKFKEEGKDRVTELEAEAKQAAAEINRSLTDALLRGFEDGKGFAENFRDTLENMFKTLILTPIIQPILQPISEAISALMTPVTDGIKAFVKEQMAQLGGMTVGGVPASSLGTGAALAYGQFELGRQLHTSGSNLSADQFGALTTLGGPFGMALAGLDKLAGGGLFGTKYRTTDAGVDLDILAGGDVEGRTFQRQKKKRSLGRGTKRRTRYDDLEEGAESEIENMVGGFLDSLGAMADELGLSSSAIDSFTTNLRVSTKGMDAEEASAAVTAALREVFGGLTETVIPYLSDFAVANEDIIDTLRRVAGNLGTVNAVLDLLDKNVDVSGKGLLELSEDLVELFGGDAGALAQATARFYDAFTDEGKKFEDLTRTLEEQLSEVNLSLPETRAEFRGLVDGLDLTTAAGREALAALLNATDAANSYYSTLEQRAAEASEQARKAADDALSEGEAALGDQQDLFDDMIEQYRDAMSAVAETLEQMLARVSQARTGLASSILTVRRSSGFDDLGYANAQVEQLRTRLGVGDPGQQVDTVNELRDAIVNRYNIELNAIKSAQQAQEAVHEQQMGDYQAQQQALDDLRKYADALKFGDLSKLTLSDQLAEAQRQFRAAVQGGSAADVQSAAQRYLSLQRDRDGAGGGYTAAYDEVQASIQKVLGTGGVGAAAIYTGAFDQAIADLQGRAVEQLELLGQNLDDAQEEAMADAARQSAELTAQMQADRDAFVEAITKAAAATAEKIGQANTEQIAQLKATTDLLVAAILQGAAITQANTSSAIAAASVATENRVRQNLRNDSLNGQPVIYSGGVVTR